MLGRIRDFGKDELVKGSLTLFIMMGIFNFLNYIFHFSMARMLEPADYGVLAVLISITYVFLIPSEVIQTVITKYTSKLNTKKDLGAIKFLLNKSMRKCLLFSSLFFAAFVLISLLLAIFLKIEFYLFVLTGLFVFYLFIVSILRGVMQGRRKFTALGLGMMLESSLKVILPIFLVFIGWKVWGALVGILIGNLVAFLFSLTLIREISSSKSKNTEFKGIYSYSWPVFVAMFAVILIFSLDIILAKRFFSPELAGKYAVISMLGKMIYLGTNAIGKAMFPFTSEEHEKGKQRQTKELMKKSVKIVILISAVVLFFYLFFPKLVIRILFGPAYVGVFDILFTVGLAFTFLSLSNTFILYNLSLNKTKKSFVLFFFVILQIVLLGLFHSTLLEFSLALLAGNFLMFLYTLFLLKR